MVPCRNNRRDSALSRGLRGFSNAHPGVSPDKKPSTDTLRFLLSKSHVLSPDEILRLSNDPGVSIK